MTDKKWKKICESLSIDSSDDYKVFEWRNIYEIAVAIVLGLGIDYLLFKMFEII